MQIKNKSVLVLGGAGLVGRAVCREFLSRDPSRLIVSSLRAVEIEETLADLAREFPGRAARLSGVHGNLFVREELKDASRGDLMGDAGHRRAILEDTLLPLTDDVLARSFVHRVLTEQRPDIVVDCVNTATALAYQDLYRSAADILDHLDAEHGVETFRAALERHLCTLYTPQLIRHVQILYKALCAAGTGAYIKIGTSGTGGMGMNIPYTHSEERPSRMLLSKSAMAGAHTMLLFLMARTPGGPIVKEIKPTAAIAWKRIGFGPVTRGGQPIVLHDCPPADAVDLETSPDLGASRPYRGDGGEVLRSVYIDTGENGMFSRSEFEVLTSLGQMEFVTPEEIARIVRFEVEGVNTGHDVVNALDNACMGPTYRAGLLRQRALERLAALEREHGVASVAFEMLGPPRLSKLLFEAEILRRTRRTAEHVLADGPGALSEAALDLVTREAGFRSEMISIGVPILLPDGRRLLRGPQVVIPTPWDDAAVTPEAVDRWAEDGWVDLRPENFRRWQARFRKIEEDKAALPPDAWSSRDDRPASYWDEGPEINIGRTVGWLFISEEQGLRMKA